MVIIGIVNIENPLCNMNPCTSGAQADMNPLNTTKDKEITEKDEKY
jgi:hypothetical protein